MSNRCIHCYDRLGLGTVSKAFWDGLWWKSQRFCSTKCRDEFAAMRREALRRKLAIQSLFRRAS